MTIDIVDPRSAARRRAASATTVAALTVGVGVGVGVALSAAPAGAAPVAPNSPAGSTASTNSKIDANSRDAVQAAFTSWFLPSQNVPIGWDGSAAGCVAGAPSPTAQAATLSTVNYFRAQSGLPSVTFDPGLSYGAQQAALMMTANNSLSHTPPGWWRCWTGPGADAAARSNLSLGTAGAQGVTAMMQDSGASNTPVGHRRWILDPTRTTMGAGSTSNALALQVMGASRARLDTNPVAWPSAGYFPRELEPGRRWSLSIPGADFSGASVTVTGPGGQQISTSRHAPVGGYADPTLVWEMNNLIEHGGLPDRTYRVTVNGIRGWWSSSHTYNVTMIDGVAPNQSAPVGDLSMVQVVGNQVTVRGWALDHNSLWSNLQIELRAAGQSATVHTGWDWPELEQFGLPRYSAYAHTMTLPPGSHDVCAYALDHNGTTTTGVQTLIGCRQAIIK